MGKRALRKQVGALIRALRRKGVYVYLAKKRHSLFRRTSAQYLKYLIEEISPLLVYDKVQFEMWEHVEDYVWNVPTSCVYIHLACFSSREFYLSLGCMVSPTRQNVYPKLLRPPISADAVRARFEALPETNSWKRDELLRSFPCRADGTRTESWLDPLADLVAPTASEQLHV